MMGLVKIYTKTGDSGSTSLGSGGRVPKSHPRVEAYGTVDELSSVLGLLRTEPLPDDVGERTLQVQEVLLAVGAVLADPKGRFAHEPAVWSEEPLERWIDQMEAELESLRSFIIPGGCRAAALAHVARATCRRAERRVQAVADADGVSQGVLPYLNRLSDTLFVLARFLNSRLGVADVPWRSGGV